MVQLISHKYIPASQNSLTCSDLKHFRYRVLQVKTHQSTKKSKSLYCSRISINKEEEEEIEREAAESYEFRKYKFHQITARLSRARPSFWQHLSSYIYIYIYIYIYWCKLYPARYLKTKISNRKFSIIAHYALCRS